MIQRESPAILRAGADYLDRHREAELAGVEYIGRARQRSAAAYLEKHANHVDVPVNGQEKVATLPRVALPSRPGASGAFKWLTSAARVQVQEKSGKGRTPLAGGGIADLRC